MKNMYMLLEHKELHGNNFGDDALITYLNHWQFLDF